MKTVLKRALAESLPVQIIYQSKENIFTKRTILVRAINDTYINAFCLSKKQARIFKVDMILAAEPVKNNYFYA